MRCVIEVSKQVVLLTDVEARVHSSVKSRPGVSGCKSCDFNDVAFPSTKEGAKLCSHLYSCNHIEDIGPNLV